MNAPKNAQYMHEGLYYKKGVHGMVFKWTDFGWTKSTKRWSDVMKGNEVK